MEWTRPWDRVRTLYLAWGGPLLKLLEIPGDDDSMFLAALEDISYYEDPFGGPSMSFSPTKHQGGDYLTLYQVRDGKWEIVERNIPY